MFDTPAKIISAVVLGLGTPEALLLQEAEVANVVFRRLAFYYEGIRQSDQNLSAKCTSEFTTTDGTKDMTVLASDISIPLWCERKIYDGTYDTWEFVPTVNLDTLQEFRASSKAAVSFYGDTPNQISAQFSRFGDEVSDPLNTYRVWYSPVNSFNGNRDATVSIPDSLTGLVVVDSQLNILPLLLANAAKYLDKQPQLSPRMDAWGNMIPLLREEKQEWLERWETWRKRSRGSHRALNHREVLDI